MLFYLCRYISVVEPVAGLPTKRAAATHASIHVALKEHYVLAALLAQPSYANKILLHLSMACIGWSWLTAQHPYAPGLWLIIADHH